MFKKIKRENERLKNEIERLKNEILLKDSLNFNIEDNMTADIARKLTSESATEEKVKDLIGEINKLIRKECSHGRIHCEIPLYAYSNIKVYDVVKKYYESKGFSFAMFSIYWESGDTGDMDYVREVLKNL